MARRLPRHRFVQFVVDPYLASVLSPAQSGRTHLYSLRCSRRDGGEDSIRHAAEEALGLGFLKRKVLNRSCLVVLSILDTRLSAEQISHRFASHGATFVCHLPGR